MTPTKADVSIAALRSLAAFDQCVALQDVVWGYDITGMMTQKVFLLASEIGGQVLGAYVRDAAGQPQLAGYAMALPGYRAGRAYLHSHHLAVLPQYRDLGIGRRLKLAQRDDAIARGIDLIEWTFDPLEIRNAHLNVARLGAVIRRYKRNFYGPSSSPLHGGLPTDRVVAEWWLRSSRVERCLSGEPVVVQPVAQVDVPAAIAAWKSNDAQRALALEAQRHIAAALEDAFREGLAVMGYERQQNGDGRFLLAAQDVAADEDVMQEAHQDEN